MNEKQYAEEKAYSKYQQRNHSLSTILGENEIVIPDKFYKVVLAQGNGGCHAAGLLFVNPPQRKSKIIGKPPVKRPLESYLATIDEIEGITGIDFFPSLPDETENALESRKQMIP